MPGLEVPKLVFSGPAIPLTLTLTPLREKHATKRSDDGDHGR